MTETMAETGIGTETVTETAVEGESETATEIATEAEIVTEIATEAETVTEPLLRCQFTDRNPAAAATLQRCSQSKGRRDSKREMRQKMR